jgi:aspartokinase
MVDTVGIGGIKLSGELIQVDFLETEIPGEKLLRFLNRIASAKISIPHLHQGNTGAAMQTTFCIAARDFQGLRIVPGAEPLDGWTRILPSVGTLSLFPHGYDLSLVSRVIHVLGQRGIPIYGMSSSVSILVIHTDYSLLDRAAEAVLTVCRLPKNHTPLRPVVMLGGEAVETIAVYWEPKMRIYGMNILPGLTSLRLKIPEAAGQYDYWREFEAVKGKFRLLTFQRDRQERLICDFLIESGHKAEIHGRLRKMAENNPDSPLVAEDDREIVAFHGPHFQDRYGIAGQTFATLRKAGIDILASGCTGTSIHLVVGAGQGQHVKECLQEICVVPV